MTLRAHLLRPALGVVHGYRVLFWSVCRLLNAANGPGERHDWIAALLLATIMLLNLCAVLAALEHRFGIRVEPMYDKSFFLGVYGALIAFHLVVLVRGRDKNEWRRAFPPDWVGVVAIVYMVGSTLMFLNIR